MKLVYKKRDWNWYVAFLVSVFLYGMSFAMNSLILNKAAFIMMAVIAMVTLIYLNHLFHGAVNKIKVLRQEVKIRDEKIQMLYLKKSRR